MTIHLDTPTDLIEQAKQLLAQAGAVYTIWTADYVRSEAEQIHDDATEAEVDAIVDAAWPIFDLADTTNRDWQIIGDAIANAVASGAHREKVAA